MTESKPSQARDGDRGGTPIAAVLQRAVDETARLVRADGALICLLDETTGLLRFAYEAGISEARSRAWARALQVRDGGGLIPQAIAERRVRWTDDYLADASFRRPAAVQRIVSQLGLRSLAVAPMIVDDEAIGALGVYADRTAAFDQAQIALVTAFADHAAASIANGRLIDELRRSREQIIRRVEAETALREIATAISAIRDPDEVVQRAVDEAARLLGGDGARIDLLDEGSGALLLAYQSGATRPTAEEWPASEDERPDHGVSGRAIRDSAVFYTGDYLADARFIHGTGPDAYARSVGISSVISAPLIGETGPFGALTVYAGPRNAFGEGAAAVLEALANQAAIALTNARLIEELDRSRAELERRADAERALREIGARLTAIRDPGDVLQYAVNAAARLLRGDGALLDLIDPATGMIRWAYDSGIETEDARDILRRLELPLGHGLFGRAIAERRVVASGDYATDPGFIHALGSDEFARRVGYRSMLAAPLISEAGALGVLGVYTTEPEAFDDADVALLGAFADQATIAITNSRLIDELARSRAEVARRAESERTLREIAARITSLRDPGEVLQQVVDESKRLLGSDGAHLTLISDDRTYLTPVVVAGGTDETTEAWLKTQEFPIGGGLNGLAAELNRPIWTVDYLVDPRIPHDPDDQETAERMGLRGMAVAPLRAVEGETLGTLAISYRTPREVSDDEVQLLQGLADQAAIAVTNLRLYERLAGSEARYRFLVQNAPDIVWSLDADGRWTYVSPAIERLGWTADQLIGRPFAELVHEDHRADLLERWGAAITTGALEPQRFRSALRAPDGTPIAVEIVGNPILEDGRLVGGYGVTRDVREQDRLERELRDSESRYRFLVQSSPDLIWAADLEGRFTFLSDRSLELFGHPPDELIGSHWSRVVHRESLAEANRRWADVLASPTEPQKVRLSLLGPDGRAVSAELSTIARVADDGRVVGALGSVRDVSERDRLERELRQQAAELAAGEERAHLARELHDSVTQALFSMTLLTRSIELLLAKDPSAAAEKLVALRELQRDALAETRALIFELRPSSLDQDGLVKALRMHTAAVQGRIGLPVVIEADDVGRLPHDTEDALYRIAQEALHNVVKHANARRVRIRLDRDPAGVRLAVEDDGGGFDAATVPGGHLGLTGMRARADKVGGTLTVESRAGKGTRVEVLVPVPEKGDRPPRAAE